MTAVTAPARHDRAARALRARKNLEVQVTEAPVLRTPALRPATVDMVEAEKTSQHLLWFSFSASCRHQGGGRRFF